MSAEWKAAGRDVARVAFAGLPRTDQGTSRPAGGKPAMVPGTECRESDREWAEAISPEVIQLCDLCMRKVHECECFAPPERR